ncbi:uncharacterized protein si:ch211-167b20.8 [Danio aesculapii]|uniref:uncharacterized protein si:ch211-167b20.8 n=1 Tax=Danio aesculapii TaxID=1142201 RepID=UPI0024BF7777|nr:uncharacterized protein si:ch211-167b20.8 [Danio aesculapii]
MAQGNNNNFLTIPSQQGLFKTVRVDRSEDNSNDEDEEETEEDVRLIPRSSPVPRKRGSSIADETAEYMRIRLALTDRRVSFVDSTGGELADVRMFVPFDSDEEDNSRWEEEEAKYRKAYSEPTYRLWPEFQALTGPELLLAVHTNKLEVDSVTPVPDEPLSFDVVIRVLNISFHKSVYVRSTMDGWINHFDYPAEYVLDSNDGETDKFSAKLSFAPPYLFNGARIDFVVRYETSDGEFWANNSGRNYSVTLLQSYEEDSVQTCTAEKPELRGILKPPRYRTASGYDDSDDREDAYLSNDECEAPENQDSFAQPAIVQPEIDIETAKNVSSSPESTKTSSMAGCSLSTSDTPYGEPLPLESESSINLPKIEESGLRPSILSIPQSQSTQESSEAQDPVYNVLPSMSFSVPVVLVHSYDRQETNNNGFEDSNNPNQLSHPQNGMLAQVPFELGQPSLAAFPNTTHTEEESLKEFQEKKDVVEMYDKLSDIKEEPSQNVEGDKTCIYRSEDPTQASSSKKLKVVTEDVEELIWSEGLENPLNEEGLKAFQEKEDVVEVDDRLADIQEESSENKEEEKTYIHRSEFPKQLPSSTPLNLVNVDLEKVNLSEFLENRLDEEPKQPPSSIQVNVATEDVEKLSLSDGLENPLVDSLKDLQENEDVVEMVDSLADIQEEPSQNIEEDKTYIYKLEFPKQPSSSIQVNVATEDQEKLSFSDGLDHPLEGLKNFQEKDVVEMVDSLADILEEPGQNTEEDKTYSHKSEDPKSLPSSKEVNIATKDTEKHNLSEERVNPLNEKGLKDFQEKEDVVKIDVSLADILEKPSQNTEEDETFRHRLEDPKLLPSKEVHIATEDVEKLILSEDLKNPLDEKCLKDFQEKEDAVEIDEILADILEEPSQDLEKDTTCIQLFEGPKLPPSSKEVNIATEDAEKLSDSSEHPLDEGVQEQEVDLVSLIGIKTTKVFEVESTKTGDEEPDALVVSYLETTLQERVTQSLLIHPTSQEALLDPRTLASILPEDPEVDNQTVSMCTSEHPASQPEKPALVSGSETSPRAFDHQPSTVQTSAEDYLRSEADELSQEACKDLEPQHTLPGVDSELSQISKDQAEVSLSTCLMVSVTFFTAVICLAVGIQEPSAFLCVGLFLLSLWF